MNEYNELTKALLEEGYTAENHPSYVKVASGMTSGTDPLQNYYGGFEYTREALANLVYKTGCGFFVKGENLFRDMVCGKRYCPEDGNPVVICPCFKGQCDQTFSPELIEGIGKGQAIIFCECHKTESAYENSNSIEHEKEKMNEEIERLKEEFSKKRNERVCINHMHYDSKKKEWTMKFNPRDCTNCPNHYAYCSILGKKFSGKKANVFYDVKTEFDVKKEEWEQFGLFDKEHHIEIVRGYKVFSKAMPIELCEIYAKSGIEEIRFHYDMNNRHKKILNKTLTYDVINVRAEKKDTRDLLQDLEDIKNGIKIDHESDLLQNKKTDKKQRIENAKKARGRKYEKRIVQNGWESMDFNEKKLARKVLDDNQIMQANEKYIESKKPKEAVVQMSLFDLGMEVVL